jgi:hypothetical protein
MNGKIEIKKMHTSLSSRKELDMCRPETFFKDFKKRNYFIKK